MTINYIKKLTTTDKIVEIIDFNENEIFSRASVIIVTYNTNQKLLSQNLNSLSNQFDNNFEIIIVDNSEKTDVKSVVSKYNLKYIKLNKNYGLSLARNIGIKFAKGDIVIFLDDDAIPANDFVEEHIRAYKENNIFGLRGRAIPKTDSFYNKLAVYYDMGDKIIPSPICLEGNSSFKRDILLEIGGFNSELCGSGGHEGLELSYRIISKYKDRNLLIYYPKAIIYHDNRDTFYKNVKKSIRQSKHSYIIQKSIPDIWNFYGEYNLITNDVGSLNVRDRIKLKILRRITSFISKYYAIKLKMNNFQFL